MAGLKCVADREEANGSLKQRRLNSSRSWAFKGWQNLDRKVQIRPPSLGNGKNVPVEGVGGVEAYSKLDNICSLLHPKEVDATQL